VLTILARKRILKRVQSAAYNQPQLINKVYIRRVHIISVDKILKRLSIEYFSARCYLVFINNFELIVSARLSAQCKDEMVNNITPKLFKKFPNIRSLSLAYVHEIENIIRPCGLFKIKAKNLKEMSVYLVKNFNGKVPFGVENLQKLPGIGRKTANLVMWEAFKVPSIIVDTHVSRVTKRIGFHNEDNRFKIEIILQNIFHKYKKDWSKICHKIVAHGKNVCKARLPNCEICCVKLLCLWYTKEKLDTFDS